LNGTKEGWTAKRPRRNWPGRVRAYRRGREKEGGRYGVIRGTDQKIDTNSKENERLHKEAEDEEPMELKEEDLVKPIVIKVVVRTKSLKHYVLIIII
jgi:hypothetical protein